MKTSARCLTTRIRKERIRDYASATRKVGHKIGHADHNRPLCSNRGCIFHQITTSSKRSEEAQQKQNFRPSNSIEPALP
jgi:hypothetical protein